MSALKYILPLLLIALVGCTLELDATDIKRVGDCIIDEEYYSSRIRPSWDYSNVYRVTGVELSTNRRAVFYRVESWDHKNETWFKTSSYETEIKLRPYLKVKCPHEKLPNAH